MAKKLVSKKAEQVLRSRARGPVCGLSVPPCPSAHLEPPHPGAPRAPGHIGASPSIPDARHDSGYRPGLYPYLGPRSLRSAQQVRHVPSPQGVSQHKQEGPSSSGAGEIGAAGAAGIRVCALPGTTRGPIRCASLHGVSSCALAPLLIHSGCINPVSIVTRLHRHLLYAQVSKADGGRANEQQKQPKQQKQTPKQTAGRKSRVASLSPNPAGAVSVDGVGVLIPTICARITHSLRLLAQAPVLACVGRTVGRAGGGQGRCDTV